MKVLLAVDEAALRERVAEELAAQGHAVAEEGEEEIVIVDDVARCERIRRARPAIPILVIDSEGDVAARVAALRAGADDALSVPFAGSQMGARLDALGRRARLAPADAETLEIDGCRLDLGACSARRGPVETPLTAREVGILRWLHRHRERAVSRAELLAEVWGASARMETRTVDMTIANLRKKIERDPARPAIVVSVKGVGYRLGA
jgi:two-component system response regulator RegX3